MDPTRWGPKLWFMLHTISFNYPDLPTYNDKVNTKNFYEILRYIIPCEVCRVHYSEHLGNMPIDNYLDSKESLINWVLKLHNTVNESINKPTWSLEQLKNHYSQIYSEKCNINKGKCSSGGNGGGGNGGGGGGSGSGGNFIERHFKLMSLIIMVSILGMIIYLIKRNNFKCYNI
jgi:hypothetical protein